MSIIAPIAIIPIITNWESVWLPLCILAVMTSVMIYNGLLMIGRAFSIKDLENYAKSELLQAAANGFMVIFFVLILGGALELAGSLIEGQMACGSETINIENTESGIGNQVMNSAYEAIQCNIQEKSLELAEAQESILTDAETKTAFFVLNLQMSVFGITFFKGDWVTEEYQYVEKLRVANNLITNMLVHLNTQQELITYIKNNMLGIFLPLGLLLRCFYFTRGPGAFMMALGIGLYYIFPVFYVLLDPGFISLPDDAGTSGEYDDPAKYCYPTMSSTVSILNSVNSGESSMASSGLNLDNIEEELASAYSQILLHPLIAFFLTMVFVRYIMTILGADSSDLTKMFTKVI